MSRPSRRSLNGQVILITGAAGGIGRATAAELGRRGAKLMLSDIDERALEGLASTIGAASHPCDTTDLSQCERLVATTLERYGRIDVVWANAGVSAYGPLDLIAPTTAAHVVGVNLLGSHNTIRAALPAIIDARGYVAATCSVASFAHQPGHSAYAASKAGLEAMCNALRTELAGTGVEVGTIHPGWIATPMVTEKDDHLAAFQRFREALPAPFNVTGEPGELAPKIADAFARRKRRLVYPRAGWLAHVARPLLTLPLLTTRTRAAAPEIRQLFIEQVEVEGSTVGMSERYAPTSGRG